MVKIMENPIKMDDLGVPVFSETSIWGNPSESLVVYTLLYNPKDPFLCPKDPGIPRTFPMTKGMGWKSTINPTNFQEGSGFLGGKYQQ